ncbi:MAG: hypothetical protein PHN78_05700 [Dehalococcoidales bacterium]|nr:hypothetical protein [Dehalococcoidales bacterium]
MHNLLKAYQNKKVAGQEGQALVSVLILWFLGSLLVLNLLTFSTSGLKTVTVYEKKTNELYAADAGMQDAIWQIKYDYLETLLTDPPYLPYDFNTNWTYSISDNINTKEVNVTIQNVWIPKYLAVPSEAEASAIIEADKLIVTSTNGTSSYKIKITYYPETGEDLSVERLGVWLPRGFNYVTDSSNLEVDEDEPYYSEPETESHAGGQVVLWSFSSVPFTVFPGVNPTSSPWTAEVTFRFASSQAGAEPDAVAWITTSGVPDIPFSWEADTKVYKITSQAGSTRVESYIAKSETRLLRSGIAGDYRATGNSLMIDDDDDGYYRETLLAETSTNVTDIPIDATVRAAYLYWSAWRNGVIFLDTCENFDNWNRGAAWSISYERFRGHYSTGGDTARYFTLQNSLDLSSYSPGSVNVTWNQSKGGTIDSSDGLNFGFSTDNGSTWTDIQVWRGPSSPPSTFSYAIPDTLTNGFRMRFYLVGFSGWGDYGYISNITVTTSAMLPDTSIIFKIDGNQVFFSDNGTPQQGAQKLVASRSQVMTNYIGSSPAGFSYCCFQDVTALIKAFSTKAPDPAVNHPGNAYYTVGDVAADPAPTFDPDTEYQLAYAGWSLVIVYSGAETKGHCLYLYDNFMHSNGSENIDFDNDGQPGGTTSGFIVPEPIGGEVDAAKLTAFVGEGDLLYTGDYIAVNGIKLWDGTTTTGNSASSPNNVWNSRSLGMTADGVDIDTFHITWASGILHTGDTSAQIDVPTQTDEWNLVYIILSFRTEPKASGALSYFIGGEY